MNVTGSKTRRCRGIVCVLALCLGGTLVWWIADSAAGEDKGKDAAMERMIAGLESHERRTRDQSVDAILAQSRAVIPRLIELVGADGKRSDETRSAAAYVLGELRASEAVPTLSKALANPPKEKLHSDIDRYDEAVFTALVGIGRSAVPAMIANIESSDEADVVRGSLDVLYHVLGGKQHTLELLGKIKDRAKDEKMAKRIGAAIEYAVKHYSGEDPLY